MSERSGRGWSAVLAIGAGTVALLGPDWPSRSTELKCGERHEVRATFKDMDACSVAMVEASEHCFCSVRESRFAPFYYLILVPGILTVSIRMLSKGAARGMVVVGGIVCSSLLLWPPVIMTAMHFGLRVPLFLQWLVIVWPQLVFFGPTLFAGDHLLVEPRWSHLLTVAFWALMAAVFGAVADRPTSLKLLIPLGLAWVFTLVVVVRLVAPALGWSLLLVFP